MIAKDATIGKKLKLFGCAEGMRRKEDYMISRLAMRDGSMVF